MASIVIRNLDDDIKQRLREAAARHGCSMEEEARRIITSAVAAEPEYGLGTRIREIWGGMEALEIPKRDPSRNRPVLKFMDEDE